MPQTQIQSRSPTQDVQSLAQNRVHDVIPELAEDKEVEHAVRSRTAMLPGQVGSLSQRPPETRCAAVPLRHYLTQDRSARCGSEGFPFRCRAAGVEDDNDEAASEMA